MHTLLQTGCIAVMVAVIVLNATTRTAATTSNATSTTHFTNNATSIVPTNATLLLMNLCMMFYLFFNLINIGWWWITWRSSGWLRWIVCFCWSIFRMLILTQCYCMMMLRWLNILLKCWNNKTDYDSGLVSLIFRRRRKKIIKLLSSLVLNVIANIFNLINGILYGNFRLLFKNVQ